MTDYKTEIIAALRVEADRIESGVAEGHVLAHTAGEGWMEGDYLELGYNDSLIECYRDEALSDGMWWEEAAEEAHWGVYVPVFGARTALGWIVEGTVYADTSGLFKITHWMPLPEPMEVTE